MKRIRILVPLVLLVAVVLPAAPVGAEHLPAVPNVAFDLPSNGTEWWAQLSPGVYDVRATGAYWYGAGWADAECSSAAPPWAWSSVVDQFAQNPFNTGLNLYPWPLSDWQRYRYGVRITGGPAWPYDAGLEFWNGGPVEDTLRLDPLEDGLDVYIDGRQADWVPVPPSPIQFPRWGLVAGCNAWDFAYETVVVVSGINQYTKFRIHDTNYGDNSGTIRVSIHPH